MKHTPGPWHKYDDFSNSIYVTAETSGGDICEMGRDFLGGESERLANVNLILAAPDLLSSCEAMLRACGGSENWNGETHEALKLMEAAIAKARGE